MKDTQENELLSLIKYIKFSPNKYLILNSRVTIFNEAKERSEEFRIFAQGGKIRIHTIDMDRINPVEKAKILYNHLVYKRVPKDYYTAIRLDRRYLKIVGHANYTPRIIEHITFHANYCQVPADQYFDYIYDNLSNPEDIWKNEFNVRLKSIDRAFLTTLYSLTDTSIDSQILKRCYEKRLSLMSGVDSTLDNYKLVLARLNQSIVSIYDNKGIKQIGVINPSVNDYLKAVLSQNHLELEQVKKSILKYSQIERCYSESEKDLVLQKMFLNGNILNLEFESESEKRYSVVSWICSHNICSEMFDAVILDFLSSDFGYNILMEGGLSHLEILKRLLCNPLCSFYKMELRISDKNIVEKMMEDVDLEDLIEIVDILHSYYEIDCKKGGSPLWFSDLCCNKIKDALSEYIDTINISDYCDNYDIRDLINQNTKSWYSIDGDEDIEFDEDRTVTAIEQWLKEDIEISLLEKLADLPEGIRPLGDIQKMIDIDLGGIVGIVNAYLEPDGDDYDGDLRHGGSADEYINEIDAIFDRY